MPKETIDCHSGKNIFSVNYIQDSASEAHFEQATQAVDFFCSGICGLACKAESDVEVVRDAVRERLIEGLDQSDGVGEQVRVGG